MENTPDQTKIQLDGNLALKTEVGTMADFARITLKAKIVVLFSIDKRGFELSLSSDGDAEGDFFEGLTEVMTGAMEAFLTTRIEKAQEEG